MRLCTLPICAGLLLAPHANADEAGLEAGFGLVDCYYFSHLDDDWHGHTGIGHAGGAFWRKPVATGDRRSLLVGARLGGLFHLGGAAYPWYVDLDVAGALIANDPKGGPRLVWGIGPSWNAGRSIRSFEIEQEAGSAFGVHGYLGYGLSFTGASSSLLLETRVEVRSRFTHERRMTRLSTGETASVDEKAGSVGLVIYAGYAWGT